MCTGDEQRGDTSMPQQRLAGRNPLQGQTRHLSARSPAPSALPLLVALVAQGAGDVVVDRELAAHALGGVDEAIAHRSPTAGQAIAHRGPSSVQADRQADPDDGQAGQYTAACNRGRGEGCREGGRRSDGVSGCGCRKRPAGWKAGCTPCPGCYGGQ